MSRKQGLVSPTCQRYISSMSSPHSNKEHVGVIGLGIMGGAFARNIINDGFSVFGYDTDAGARDRFAQFGGTVADSVSDVVDQSDVIITALPTVEAFHTVMTGENGISSTRKKGLIVVECSTLSIKDKTLAHDRLTDVGIVLLDCPVSGTGSQAATKDLSIYVSGDESASRQCQVVLNGMARKTFYVGVFGNGSKMKFVANVLVHIHNVATAEAMVLAMKAGLDPANTFNVIKDGAGNSRIFELRAPMMVNDDYSDATMKMDIWQKDIQVISDFAQQMECPIPLFKEGTKIYKKGMEQGMEKLDTAAVCRVLEGMANLQRSTD